METIYLNGSEDVRRAAGLIQDAAHTIQSAANMLSQSNYSQQQFLDDWLIRFEKVLNSE